MVYMTPSCSVIRSTATRPAGVRGRFHVPSIRPRFRREDEYFGHIVVLVKSASGVDRQRVEVSSKLDGRGL